MDKNEVGKLTDELHANNVINKGGYRDGICSRSYSIGEQYRGAVKSAPIVMSIPKRKLLESRKLWAHAENESLTLPIHWLLRDDLQHLSIDELVAWKIVNSLPTEVKRFYNSVALVHFVTKQHRSSVDRFGKRFHSNITSLNSRLRELLRVDGDRLVSNDVRNCQMLCLSGVIGTATEDAQRFREACEMGQLYESLQSNGISRNEVKEQLQPYLFGKPRMTGFSRIVTELYPTIDSYLRNWKSKPLTESERLVDLLDEPHKRTASTLQRMESSIVIETACAEIKRLKRNAFLATVHDSILCREVDCELVQRQIKIAFYMKGLNCLIKAS